MTTRIRVETSATLKDGNEIVITQIGRHHPAGSSGSRKEWNSATRIYVSEHGETVYDDLQNRFGRPVNSYRIAVKEALELIDVEDPKMRWSQKAGCSCGCSPGFILRESDNSGMKRLVGEDGYTPIDVYVRITKGALGESKSRNIFTKEGE